ncbi:MAG: hypothetical protein BWX72_00311 [Firmicutes bacterium ADurb.Bin080]|nr:MAG: hypothetical protein BWX72_00311 [Firmicutes bacterium ADurb.Bin080]
MSFIGIIIALLGSIWFGQSLLDWLRYISMGGFVNLPSTFLRYGVLFGPPVIIVGLILFLHDMKKEIRGMHER